MMKSLKNVKQKANKKMFADIFHSTFCALFVRPIIYAS